MYFVRDLTNRRVQGRVAVFSSDYEDIVAEEFCSRSCYARGICLHLGTTGMIVGMQFVACCFVFLLTSCGGWPPVEGLGGAMH